MVGKTTKRAKTSSVAEAEVQEVQERAAAFPIVGIGASAGGLEAFEKFFCNAPSDTGMAFVLVPHLDPTHASLLSEILQRTTAMPVVEVQDQMAVVPNHVYIIPPNRDMAILGGALQLNVTDQPRGQRMPIDAFLRSLAEDQQENSIGIILSGTGSDGTLGLRAILGAGGICLVQEPSTAKYDGMPASAIRAGYASHVLPVEEMPQVLLKDKQQRSVRTNEASFDLATTSGINQILLLLRSATGHDFTLYKKSTIGRRIRRRMAQHNIEDAAVYARYLKEHPSEVKTLFKELLINVTSFFRDPEAFVTLKQEILPKWLADKPADYVFRVWIAGCASGEEAYSIAMLLRELMDESDQKLKTQIYATDLAEDQINVARSGSYPANIVEDVSPERLRRFFIKDQDNNGGYKVKKEIREMVVFAIQNVIKDPPFTKLDLLSCRNLMIYLEPELQNRLIRSFHYALKPGGTLFLSTSESIANHTELFSPINRKWKLYRATHSAASDRLIMVGGLGWTEDKSRKTYDDVAMNKEKTRNIAELTNRVLLQSYAPASVTTDKKGNILYVYGDTGRYLRPAPGPVSNNVVDMAREGLQLELRAAIQSAADTIVPTLDHAVSVKTNGGFSQVNLSVRRLPGSNSEESLLLLSFKDVAQTSAKPRRGKRSAESAEPGRVEELEHELAFAKENLQATIEEQQASTEELKSTNEEMQSTNEELQSTNEELETSQEELQSLNEELLTVNAELQAKIEQLADMQNDMKNLFDNINVGTIFLDEHLCIRRFTREATRAYRLVATDVGRPLSDIKSNLEDEDLLAKAQAVLDSLMPYALELRTTDGAWFLVRIQPYRTLDNVIEGVVMTFTDISQRVMAEEEMRLARNQAEAIVDTVREPLVVLDAGLNVVSASRSFFRLFQVTPKETVGRQIYDLGARQWNIPALRELLESILPRDQTFEDYEVEQDFPTIGRRKILLNARRIVGKSGEPQLILLAMENVS